MSKFSALNIKNISITKLWVYPIVFGLLGGLMGLFLRYVYTGTSIGIPLKNLLHSHSHVMLLGFVFNALVVTIIVRFTERTDVKLYRLYVGLQLCVAVLLVGFVIQGYALYTIIFSTLHLWISYFLLIRIWKRLIGEESIKTLVKIGVVFHFVASLGPYALGPLKVLGFENTPWYQQSIYFYLHFQYFGSFFLWMLAVFFKETRILLSKEQIWAIVVSVILLFCHSLDFSFDHWQINSLGFLGSVLLFGIIFSLRNDFVEIGVNYQYDIFYRLLLLVLFINILGSFPVISDLVVENRFLLIAWLHFLFLGVYLPFIWLELPVVVSGKLWVGYVFCVLLTELLLVFPNEISDVLSVSSMMLLFISYFGVVFCICVVHLTFLIEKTKK